MHRPHTVVSKPRRALSLFALALALTIGSAPAALAQGDSALERSVKAAFLYKFLAYTEFPASVFADAGAALVIGVLGADDMAQEVHRIVAGRAINGRPVTVRALRESDMPTLAPGVIHLLFVAGSDSGKAARLLRQAPPGPILSVSECGSGLQAGSTINFRIIEQHVRFDVALDTAEKNNIKLSSRLLSVANHVTKGVP